MRALRKRLSSPRAWLRAQVEPVGFPLLRLGSEYGGWTIVDTPLLNRAAVVLCGAGEDLSFDLALQARYGVRALIVDPTPRASAHYHRVLEAARAGEQAGISGTEASLLTEVDFGRIEFAPVAIWTEEAVLQFWEPADPAHVSYSLANLQQTDRAIEVPTERLQTLLRRLGVDEIALLKLDVEGVEVPILHRLAIEGPRPLQVLVEFDEMNFPAPETNEQIRGAVRALRQAGYRLAHFDGRSNCLFYYGRQMH